jgi:hypothetical protein
LARVIRSAIGAETGSADDDLASVIIEIEAAREPFSVSGAEQIARGAWRRGDETIFTNVCTSGFDCKLSFDEGRPRFVYRRRPTLGVRAASLLASRARQLTLLTVLAYPAMWWASLRGRAPIHVSAFETSGRTTLVAGPTGIGKSSVLRQELTAGARAISDNLCVSDGLRVWPVTEPMRIEGAEGMRAPHGRAERPISARIQEARPDAIVVLRRGPSRAQRLDPATAAQSIAAGTYMAGELRRFWSFAATLSAALGIGPAHPPVVAVAEALAKNVPCFEVARDAPDTERLASVLTGLSARANEGVA